MILTVDVEHDWGMASAKSFQFLRGLFDFLDDTDGSATLFVLGELAEKLAETGVSKRAEIASHSMSHVNLQGITENDLIEELRNSKSALETTLNTKVDGFRAPYFLPPDNLWDVLKQAGYTYSSSLASGWFPGRYRRRLKPAPFDKGEIKEFPVQAFRLLPLAFGLPFMRMLWPFSRVLEPGKPYMFYYHPTELMTDPPGEEMAGWSTRLLYGMHRGMRARRILYGFLQRHAPTQSIRDYMKS